MSDDNTGVAPEICHTSGQLLQSLAQADYERRSWAILEGSD